MSNEKAGISPNLLADILTWTEDQEPEKVFQTQSVSIDLDQVRNAQFSDEPIDEDIVPEALEEIVAPEEPTIIFDFKRAQEEALDALPRQLEAILFTQDKVLTFKKLFELYRSELERGIFLKESFTVHIRATIQELKTRYHHEDRGIELVEVAEGFQFRTPIDLAPFLLRNVPVKVQRLSSGAMETLAIVAYEQPTTKDRVDSIRGVDSSHFLRLLLDRKLIEIEGRGDEAGRPMLYKTSATFLELFQLRDLSDLPSQREIEQMIPENESSLGKDPRAKQIAKLVSEMNMDRSFESHLGLDQDEADSKRLASEIKKIMVSTPTLDLLDREEQEDEPESSEPGETMPLESSVKLDTPEKDQS